jgi:DNA invertase Pin-like site-specific DNA recombinase
MSSVDKAYIRISTDSQSTARQDDLMKALGITIIYSETKSGRTAARPILQKMLHELQPGDVLHVESISRLARSTRDLLLILEQMDKAGAIFVSHKEQLDARTAQGKFVLTIFAALAELERETTHQRQLEGIASAKSRGIRFGREQIVELPANFADIVKRWRSGEIPRAEACRLTGLTRETLRRHANKLPN